MMEILQTSPVRARPNVAVLVDGDNISATFAARIRTIAAGLGDVVVCRVYGNAILLPD